MKKCIKCGSHAFNLYAEEINQGGLCDVHYWQGRAHRAEALAQPSDSVETPIDFELAYGEIYKDQRAALAEELAQPEQEPVAVISAWSLREVYFDEDGEPSMHRSPPQRPWVGLTDGDIAYAYTLEKKFAMQYVDAKLKEKNT